MQELGYDFIWEAGKFNYDKVYDVLHHDPVHGLLEKDYHYTRDPGIYCVIKLLEKEFGTTLGYPGKLCQSQNKHRCSTIARTRSWSKYLVKHDLTKLDESFPPPFNYWEYFK